MHVLQATLIASLLSMNMELAQAFTPHRVTSVYDWLLNTAGACIGACIMSLYLMIGDRWRDVACAHEAGCAAIFLDRDWQERSPEPPFERVGSLDHAVRAVLAAGGPDPDPTEQE